MITILWTHSARRDIAAHLTYHSQRNPETAPRLEEAIVMTVERLRDFPQRGRPGRREGTRELLVQGWPYVVVYTVREERVVILRVLHTAQEWPPRATQ